MSPVAVNVGEFTFTMMVTTDMAPSFQVVAYAVLPSQSVIADYADFSTEKCFGHSVSTCLIKPTWHLEGPRR